LHEFSICKEVSAMQTQLQGKGRGRKWWTAGAVMAGLLLAPLFGTMQNAEAKPPRHAPAYGYRAKKQARSNHRSNRYRRDDKNRYQRRDRDRDTNRRYRWHYRTRRDRNGKTYRDYFRQYY
jgi:hypothetical protein